MRQQETLQRKAGNPQWGVIIVKKILSNVDNLTENEKKRLELLTNIKKMLDADYNYKDIAATLGISTRTVIRYKDCNPLERK